MDNSSEDSFELRRCFFTSKSAKTCSYDAWSATVGSNQTSYTSSVAPASGAYRFEVRSSAGALVSAWVSSGNVTIR